uniref:Putative secreted protein n=1 Tax=Anopheles darlingi TaxID=43151 RepID=A0A2M4DPK0_ANODA
MGAPHPACYQGWLLFVLRLVDCDRTLYRVTRGSQQVVNFPSNRPATPLLRHWVTFTRAKNQGGGGGRGTPLRTPIALSVSGFPLPLRHTALPY